jgi:hypothetical protein
MLTSPLLLEPEDRLAHQRPADAEPGGNRALDQRLAAADLAIKDHQLEAAVDIRLGRGWSSS